MFGLIRRISHSVLPRADRPWDDDATSNAPKSNSRKRRLSSTEREDGPKKVRGDTPLDGPSTPDVKEVTKGVKDVDLNAERMDGDESATKEAAAVPLPDALDGELDGADSIASTPEATADSIPNPTNADAVAVVPDEAAPAAAPSATVASDVPLAAASGAGVPRETGAAVVDDPSPDVGGNDAPATHDPASHDVSPGESAPQEKAEIVHVEDIETPLEDKDAEGKDKANAD